MLINFLILCLSFSSYVFGYDFEGTYEITGAGPRSGYTPYNGTLTIRKDVKGIYQATWDLEKENGTCTYIGTGFSIHDDAISFIFADLLEKKDIGILVYYPNEQGLSGIFTHLNSNLIGEEIAIKSLFSLNNE